MIKISIGKATVFAKPLDTPTARAVLDNLPFASRVQTWGDEVYFETPIRTEIEIDARDVVEKGELAFWVEGGCIVIGFGPTPISQGDEIRLAAATNIWAITEDELEPLKKVQPGDMVFIEALLDS